MAFRGVRPALLSACLSVSVLFAGCAQGGFDDGGPPDSGPRPDTGMRDAGPGMDAGFDAGVRIDAGPRDAATPDAAGTDAMPDAGFDAGPPTGDAGGLCTPNTTNIIINEVMVVSRTGAGDLGEWFEIHNRSACPINLAGLEIVSPIDIGGMLRMHTVTAGVITAGGFFVFAQSGDSDENHMLTFDYAYGNGTAGVVLNNTNDELTLIYDSMTVDMVEWSSTTAGTTRQLNRGSTGSDNSDLASSVYCNAMAIYSSATGGPYRGTPGALNEICP